jgi:peptidoglycan/LPS O-acetylase OafA/YrhL
MMVAPADPLLLVAYLAVTMIVSAISYRALELPAQAWIRRRGRAGPRNQS